MEYRRLGSSDLIVSEMAVRAFADAGVSIVTADTGENITEAGNDPSRKLIRQVLRAARPPARLVRARDEAVLPDE